jgi:hypothetical protein
MSTIEHWIIEHYGPIEHAALGTDPLIVQVHAVAVPLFKGIEIGMGTTRDQAIQNLYSKLTLTVCEGEAS